MIAEPCLAAVQRAHGIDLNVLTPVGHGISRHFDPQTAEAELVEIT